VPKWKVETERLELNPRAWGSGREREDTRAEQGPKRRDNGGGGVQWHGMEAAALGVGDGSRDSAWSVGAAWGAVCVRSSGASNSGGSEVGARRRAGTSGGGDAGRGVEHGHDSSRGEEKVCETDTRGLRAG
jgi:hypothetical protein